MRQNPHVSPRGTRAYHGFAGSLRALWATHLLAARLISSSTLVTHRETKTSGAPSSSLPMKYLTAPSVASGSRMDSATARYFPGKPCDALTAS